MEMVTLIIHFINHQMHQWYPLWFNTLSKTFGTERDLIAVVGTDGAKGYVCSEERHGREI